MTSLKNFQIWPWVHDKQTLQQERILQKRKLYHSKQFEIVCEVLLENISRKIFVKPWLTDEMQFKILYLFEIKKKNNLFNRNLTYTSYEKIKKS